MKTKYTQHSDAVWPIKWWNCSFRFSRDFFFMLFFSMYRALADQPLCLNFFFTSLLLKTLSDEWHSWELLWEITHSFKLGTEILLKNFVDWGKCHRLPTSSQHIFFSSAIVIRIFLPYLTFYYPHIPFLSLKCLLVNAVFSSFTSNSFKKLIICSCNWIKLKFHTACTAFFVGKKKTSKLCLLLLLLVLI